MAHEKKSKEASLIALSKKKKVLHKPSSQNTGTVDILNSSIRIEGNLIVIRDEEWNKVEFFKRAGLF